MKKIHFPPDYLEKMSKVEAAVGLSQLKKYDDIIEKEERKLFGMIVI